jgi:hypothetical protein
MKVIVISSGVFVASSVVIWQAVEFAGGYSVFPLVGPLLFIPTSVFMLLFAFLASCWAAVIVVIALFRRSILLAAVLTIIVCLSWALSPWFFGHSTFLLGFGARLRTSTSLAEIESAAHLSISLLPTGGMIYGPKRRLPGTSKEEQENKRAWDTLSRYGFVHLLDDTCAVWVHPPDVSFEWGGALPGHWGICVLGSSQDSSPRYYLDSLRYSDKILLFRDH